MYLEVAAASPIGATLTYKPHPDFPASDYKPGLRLLVPLGPRLVTGYLLRCTDQLAAEAQYTIRMINDVLDQEPIFPASMVPFLNGWPATTTIQSVKLSNAPCPAASLRKAVDISS